MEDFIFYLFVILSVSYIGWNIIKIALEEKENKDEKEEKKKDS